MERERELASVRLREQSERFDQQLQVREWLSRCSTSSYRRVIFIYWSKLGRSVNAAVALD